MDKQKILNTIYFGATLISATVPVFAKTISGYDQEYEIKNNYVLTPIKSQDFSSIDEKVYNNVILKEYFFNHRLKETKLTESNVLSFSELETLIEDKEDASINSWTVSILDFYDTSKNKYQFVFANPITSKKNSENTYIEITDILKNSDLQPSGWKFTIDSRKSDNDDAKIYSNLENYLSSSENIKELRLTLNSYELDSLLQKYSQQSGWGTFILTSEKRNSGTKSIIAVIPDNYNHVINYAKGGEYSFIIGAQPRSSVVIPIPVTNNNATEESNVDDETTGFTNNDNGELDNPSNEDNTADTPIIIGDNPREGIEDKPPWENPNL